jgi:hypothetical protein
LHQVFDQVEWSPCGTQLKLRKQVQNMVRLPFVA